MPTTSERRAISLLTLSRHLDPQLGDEVVDLPCRDAVHIGLHDHAEQGLL